MFDLSCWQRIGAANIYGVPSQMRSYYALPLCFLGSRNVVVGAEYEECNALVEGWKVGDEEVSGCRILRCMPAPAFAEAVDQIELRVSFNGQWDSSQVAATLRSFDNAAVSVSTLTPSAGPISGGSPIEVRGAGFVDLGGAACVLTIGGTKLMLAADVVSNGVLRCTPSSADASSAGGLSVTIGIVLNGDPSTEVRGDAAIAKTFYFVDLLAIRLSAVHPPAGPIRGGTTLILLGEGLRACGGGACPQPPLCIFELQPDPLSPSDTPSSKPRNVSVTGQVNERDGQVPSRAPEPWPFAAPLKDHPHSRPCDVAGRHHVLRPIERAHLRGCD